MYNNFYRSLAYTFGTLDRLWWGLKAPSSLKGGYLKVTIATLYKEKINAEYATSLGKMTAYCKDINFGFSICEAALVSEGRNKQFFLSKEEDVDYIFYIDSDIVFPVDGLQKLIDLDKDIATGVYYQRTYPFRPVIYNITECNRIKNLPYWASDKPFKVEACGAGFLLIRKSVFDKFTKDSDEPFEMIKNKVGGYAGEDTSFCIKCKEKGIEIWADPTIDLGHVRSDIVYKGHWDLAKKFLHDPEATDRNEVGVEGWMTENELRWLANQSEKTTSVLEVGSWKGRSTIALLENCRGVVYSVDHFKGSDEEIHKRIIEREGSIFSQFAKNVDPYENLVVVKMDSLKASTLFPDKSIDMIFIDASHTYEEVKRDIAIWMPKARKIICGHDYQDGWPEIKRAVDDTLPDAKVYESIWYKEL